MKLAFAFLAAVAESKRQHRVAKPTSDGEKISGMYWVPATECSADIITSTENVDGQSGSVSLDDHGNYEHCFVSFASQCSNGVDVDRYQDYAVAAANYLQQGCDVG